MVIGCLPLCSCVYDEPLFEENKLQFEETIAHDKEDLPQEEEKSEEVIFEPPTSYEIEKWMGEMENVPEVSVLLQHCEIYDYINDIQWKYNVLLPENYDENNDYPSLYLLHGKGSDYDKWITSLKVKKILDYYYSRGLKDIIVIMPDAGDTYYLDGYLNGIKYESYLRNIFIPTMENLYALSMERKYKYIGGFSMGGYGALMYSLKWGEEFSFCHAMSTPVEGKNEPLIVSTLTYIDKFAGKLPYMIFDVGDKDPFLGANLTAYYYLENLDVPYQLIIREGSHEAGFWKESLFILFENLLSFIQ